MTFHVNISIRDDGDNLGTADGYPNYSEINLSTEYNSMIGWDSILIDMIEALEGAGFAGIRERVKLKGVTPNFRNEEFLID